MKQMVCSVCSYVYDESAGIPEAGIAPGTAWEDLPEGWRCPVCGAGKDAFVSKSGEAKPKKAATAKRGGGKAESSAANDHIERELTAAEMSVICSNLARGCEKQYLTAQSEDYRTLAEFFGKASETPPADVDTLIRYIDSDLSTGFPEAKAAAEEAGDRGALRALVWSEKVTRMLSSLMERYKREGDKMLEGTGVYVCTICGFIHIGDAPPEICPVCKVPGWKFEKVTGRTAQ